MASSDLPSPLVCSDVQATGQELPGLRVTVDKVVHHRDVHFPAETPHGFIYFLTIANLSTSTVRLVGRKWIIRASDGKIEVIEGDGIVGQSPIIHPGESFSYNSYHLTGQAVTAEGAFHGTAEDGRRIFVRIPTFAMTPPGDSL